MEIHYTYEFSGWVDVQAIDIGPKEEVYSISGNMLNHSMAYQKKKKSNKRSFEILKAGGKNTKIPKAKANPCAAISINTRRDFALKILIFPDP